MRPVVVLSCTCVFVVEGKLRERRRIWENTGEKVWQDPQPAGARGFIVPVVAGSATPRSLEMQINV